MNRILDWINETREEGDLIMVEYNRVFLVSQEELNAIREARELESGYKSTLETISQKICQD